MAFFQWFLRAAPLLAYLFLNSCSQPHLSIQTDYLSRKKLASYYVNTPDPMQNYPLLGERLIISWSLPPSIMAYENLYIKLTIRFGDRTEKIQTYQISRPNEIVTFVLKDQEYIDRRGIFTYKAEIIGNHQVLETWYHQMWVELITLDVDEDKNKNDEDEDDENNKNEDDED